ncbi:MAG: hypothetical protein M1839_007014 [Geoglossum umbratile]|nr:MAG: hypothetical protein M1839_007014 [Geoglossum umbratile]
MASPGTPDFNDKQDFEDADRGFIAPLIPDRIKDADGNVVWDNEAYAFILKDCPETANPSLWRQSQLCYKQGLYQVTQRIDDVSKSIYQVRGLDISNVTIVEGSTGVIIIDPLISKECAEAALQLYNDKVRTANGLPTLETVAVIYSHSHIDHYGGVEGVLPNGTTTGVEIFAPNGFMEHAVSENIYTGIAMNRRGTYMYGDQLGKGPDLQIGTGLGMTSSSGTSTTVRPESIDENTTKTVDGVMISFQLTPGTEAPAEMNIYFPDFGALCIAENATHTMHNIQTLRGALVRDAYMWSKYLDEAISLFVEGNRSYPQVLGQTGLEIAEVFKLPDTLSSQWYNQGYYGTISHNVKAVYHRYLGWFDGNPAHLWEWPPTEAGKLYLECMGGVSCVITKASSYERAGNLRFAATLLSHVLFGSDPSDPLYSQAADQLAGVFESLGYGAECGPWRNFFLVGADELRNGIEKPVNRDPDVNSMSALDLDQLIDTMAIRLEVPLTSGDLAFTIDFYVTDMTGDLDKGKNRILLNLSNCALTNRYIPDDTLGTATLVCELSHTTLAYLVMGKKEITDPDITIVSGDSSVWDTLYGYLTPSNPAFAIVTPEEYVPPTPPT